MSTDRVSNNKKIRLTETNRSDANDNIRANASNEVREHPNSRLRNTFRDHKYQRDWLVFFVLKMGNGPPLYSLATHVIQVGKLRETAVRYEVDGNDGDVYRFVQFKLFRERKKQIEPDDLLARDIFGLTKYWERYRKIKADIVGKKLKYIEKVEQLKDCVLITNLGFAEDLEECFERLTDEDKFFDAKVRHKRKEPRRLKFKGGEALKKDKLIEELIMKLKSKRMKKTDEKVSIDDLNDFLDKLVFAVNQPNESQLQRVIEDEIRKRFPTHSERTIYYTYTGKVEQWLLNATSDFSEQQEPEISEAEYKKIWHNVKPPIEVFARREENLKELHYTIDPKRRSAGIFGITVVTGLEGIGKRELVRMYVHKYGNFYDGNVVWITGKSRETRADSFLKSAGDTRLKVSIKQKDGTGEIRPIKEIIKEVYMFFKDKKSLFIFDNARPDDDLIDCLPPNIFQINRDEPNYDKPFVLIISDAQEWAGGISVINLQGLGQMEAVEFVKKRLNIGKDQSRDEEVKCLVRKLQYFPLAIKHATAYIKKNGSAEQVGIVNYLEEFQKTTEELRNSRLFRKLNNDPTTTQINQIQITYITLVLAINKISNDQHFGKLACWILYIVAHFEDERINTEVFYEEMKLAANLLDEYSLMNWDTKNEFSVHRLVQKLTRLQLQELRKEKDALRAALVLVLEDVGSNVQHAVSVWNHAKENVELVKLFSSMPRRIIDELCAVGKYAIAKSFADEAVTLLKRELGNEHVDVIILEKYRAISLEELGNYERKKDVFDVVLKGLQESSDSNHLDIARAMKNLGNAYGKLNDHERKIEFLKNALRIYQDNPGRDIEVAKTKRNLGNAYGELNNYEEKRKLLAEALTVLEKHYVGDHFEIAKTKRNLANAHGELRNYGDKRKLLEEALPDLESHYGRYHFEVAKAKRDLADAYGELDNYDIKRQLLEEALPVLRIHYGKDHLEVAKAIRNLGNVYGKLDDYTTQMKYLDEAISILKGHCGEYGLEVIEALRNKAMAHKHLGQTVEAKQLLDIIVPILKDKLGPDNPLYRKALKNLNKLTVG